MRVDGSVRWLRKPVKLQQEVLITMQWGMAVVIAFLVSGIVIPTLDAYPTNYYFWFLLGLLSRKNLWKQDYESNCYTFPRLEKKRE